MNDQKPRRPSATPSLALPPPRSGFAAPETLLERRTMPMPGGYPVDASIVTREVGLGPLSGISCAPPNPRGVLFHMHGGGFRLGSPARSQAFAATLAARLGCEVIMPAYPLAPENPFPAALVALREALESVKTDGPLVIGGDSAGGNLAVGLCLLDAAADALFLISPWLDLRIASDGYDRAASTDRLFSRAMATEARQMYLQEHPADDPLASPLLAPIGGLPDTFVLAGGVETLLDDSLAFAAGLASAGVDVECRVVPDMQHVAPTFGSDWPGAAAGLEASIQFLKRQFAQR
jgi:acetyl esterase/lipase